MRIILFCENKYAISILRPIETEALQSGKNEVLWYVHTEKIPDFPLKDEVAWSSRMQEIYDFKPEAIFVPGNIVPYYLPGVKIQIFHGYAGEKKGHWVIRRYFDTYFTQGPHFTKGFRNLADEYKDFEVVETGWPRQDWIFHHLHTFGGEKQELLKQHGKKQLVLYAPTFSPSLTSLPFIKEGLVRLTEEKDILLLLKFHPLTKPEWIEEYRKLAEAHPHMIWIEDHHITKYQLMADLMISDTSSTVYEFLLLDKPVITFRSTGDTRYWLDIHEVDELCNAFEEVQQNPEYIEKRKWIVANYDPHLDGKVCSRMLEAAEDYIARRGVPRKRKLNLWRKYVCIKTFGRIRRK